MNKENKLILDDDYDLTILEKDEDEETKDTSNQNTDTDNNEDTDVKDQDFEEKDEPEYSLSDIGKVYVIKQIHSSLDSLYSIADYLAERLTDNTDIIKLIDSLQNVRELLTVVSFNVDLYRDKLDTIIDLLRKYVVQVSKQLEQLSKEVKKKENKNK